MPCKPCENGYWKFGRTGECRYSTKAECQEDNADYYAVDSYNDYPQKGSENAKRVLRWVEKNGWGDCLTATGKKRCHQIANRENLSRETISRIASFKRHQQYKDVPFDEGCGGIAWNAWGGTEMIEWSIRKLEQIDKDQNNAFKNDDSHDYHFDFTSEMMETLHKEGKLEVKIEEDGEEMIILFTYDKSDISHMINESKAITNKYKKHIEKYGSKRT